MIINDIERLCERIDGLLQSESMLLVGIDGQCASGKTTLAGELSQRYDCNVFHMDDFFLRPEQRTPERMAQIGGNVDYERFQREVLVPLKGGTSNSANNGGDYFYDNGDYDYGGCSGCCSECGARHKCKKSVGYAEKPTGTNGQDRGGAPGAFDYRPYSCHEGRLLPPVRVTPKQLNIVEGSYSLHPYSRSFFGLAVCLTVSESVQRERILKRNKDNAQRFFDLWIPLENAYLEGMKSEIHPDVVIDTSVWF